MLDNIILEINNYLKKFNVKYIYCGSISLYLNGIKEIVSFNDVDIDFIDLNDEEKLELPIGIINEKYPIDKLHKIEEIEQRYHKINFYGEEILVSDLDYEIEVREYFIKEYKDYIFKDKALMRIEQIKKYLNS